MTRLVALAAALLLVAACGPPSGTEGAIAASETFEPIEPVLPVPAGTREIRYKVMPASQRTRRLVFEHDLVLTGAFDVGFYRPGAVAMADNGDIYVADRGNSRVVVFDRDGTALRQFGREGQGPGEFQWLDAIAVVGDRVVIFQADVRRINVFSSQGEHIEDHVLDDDLWADDALGVGDDVLLVSPTPAALPIRVGSTAPVVPWVIGVYAPDGSERRRILTTERTSPARFLTGRLAGRFAVAAAGPVGALAPGGRTYATPGSIYELVAVDADGTWRWLLHGDLPPEALTETHKSAVMASFLANNPGEAFTETIWPEHFAAIVNLETDGAGNAYVFPYDLESYFETDVQRRPPAGAVPVDVYSPDGERLFEGRINLPSWDAQNGGRVCRVEPDPDSEEEVVACYRVEEVS